MRAKAFFLKISLFLAVFWLFPFALFAQNKYKDQEFILSDTTMAFQEGKLDFPNIHKISYYHNKDKISRLNQLQREKDWANMYPALYEYVCNFGIENFYDLSSLDILWQLGRVSEYLGKLEMTKEVYRYLIKHYRGDLQKAIRRYDSLSKFDKDLYVEIDKYYEMLDLRAHIDTLKPPRSEETTLGESINSEFEEYGVALSRDDKMLFFTSKRTLNGEKKAGTSKYNEEIYVSIAEDNRWEAVKTLDQINTKYNEGSPSLSADGKTIVFARCYSPDGLGNCDLYISYKLDENTWTQAENLGGTINSEFWDSHPSLSITGDTLFFASDRKGGFGGIDIYYVTKNKRGIWQKAQNLGAMVNTRQNEVSPFIHPLQNVLFFSSDGQIVNFGSFDIYKTYLLNQRWTEPKNVGPLVNGKGSEFYFAIDSQAKTLFYAKSEAETPENLDLFSFPLPMEAQPQAIVKFSGKVTEESTGEIFEGLVAVVDLETGIEISPKYLHEDGSFQFELINQKKYMLIITGENFFRIEQMFFLDGEKQVNIAAKSIKTVRFASIEFDNGKAQLKREMENDLHLVINFLVDHPAFSLKIIGHTDSDGNADFNLKLSQERANVIKNYIASYGRLSPERIEAIGMGNSEPIIKPEVTEEDKKKNRRVEFKIYKTEEKE